MNRANQGDKLHQEDAVWVKAFQAGEKAAFDKLALKYKNKVFSLCYRSLGDYEEANDAAQDTFVKVYRSLNRFRFDAAFSTWLYRIAVNTCKNTKSSLAYRLRRKIIRIDNPEASEAERQRREIADESRSPWVELEKKEKGRLIEKAIASLPPNQSIMVILRDIEGLTYEEMVSVTGYSLGTVKSRLARARQKLRKKLKGVI